MVRPVRISNKFEHCVCPASLQEKKRSKRTYTNFPIKSLWEVFKGSNICSTMADLAEFLTLSRFSWLTSLSTGMKKIRSKMSLVVSKPAFCICETKDADQLRGDREADQRLCSRYTDSTIPLLHKSDISSLYASSVAVQQLFVSDLVGNPEDRFSYNEAQIRAHEC